GVTPTITTFTPTSGAVGKTVIITGSGFTNTTAVKFNNVSSTFRVVSGTSIKATVPIGASTGKIGVVTPGGTVLSATAFMVIPKISSFSPASGPPGLLVTIKGTSFTGTTAVKFGSGLADMASAVVSRNSILVTVPTAATNGKVK